MMPETYHSAYYCAAYEIRYADASIPNCGPVRVLYHEGHWTSEARQIPADVRRAMLHAKGDIIERRPVSSYDLGQRQKRCACGEIFVGPPNRRACDKCRNDKEGL